MNEMRDENQWRANTYCKHTCFALEGTDLYKFTLSDSQIYNTDILDLEREKEKQYWCSVTSRR